MQIHNRYYPTLLNTVLTITGGAAVGFTSIAALAAGIPETFQGALLSLEADAAVVSQPRVAYHCTDGTDPVAATNGFPMGDNEAFEIDNANDLRNFRIISANAARTHKLKIMFYGDINL